MDKHIKFWPIYSFAYLITSLFNLFIFYSAWGISFENYFSISEIGILLFRPIFLFLTSFAIGFIFSLFFNGKDSSISDNDNKSKKSLIIIFRIGILLADVFYLIKFIYFESRPVEYSAVLYDVSISLLCLSFTFVIWLPEFVSTFVKSRREFLLYFAIIFFLSSIIRFSSREIKQINNGLYFGTIVETKNYKHFSDSTSYFIGQSNSEIFIFNKSDSSVSLIPKSELVFIRLKKN